MTKQDDWVEVNQMTDSSWDRQKELVGTFIERKEDVGENHSKLYVLKKEDGTTIGVWGSTVLDTKFSTIELNSEVKIVPLGEAKSKTGKSYHDYQVFKRPAPFQEVVGPQESDLPPVESYEIGS